MAKRFFILDTHNLIYRAYYAMSRAELTDSQGQPTGAVYGLLRMLIDLVREYDPDYLAATFDSREPTFRDEFYEKYKAQRPEMPEDLRAQIPPIRNLLELLEIPVVQVEGYESDDLIATLVETWGDRGDLELVVVSNDKDTFQLVNGSVRILKQNQGISDVRLLDREEVEEEMGVAPSQVPDYLSLIGDSADNIPGVEGVGPTYAGRLLEEFETIEQMLENPERIGDCVSERLEENILSSTDQLRDSKHLILLRRDAPIELELESFEFPGIRPARLLPFCRKMEFRSLRRDLEEQMDHRPGWDELDLPVEVHPLEEVDPGDSFYQQAPLYGYACGEEPGEKPMRVKRVNWVLTDGVEARVVRVPVEPASEDDFSELRRVLFHKVLYLHNQKFLQVIGYRLGAGSEPPEEVFDLQLGSYLVDPDQDHDLNEILSRVVGTTVPDFPEEDDRAQTRWMARRAILMVEACEEIEREVEERRQRTFLETLEKPLTGILARMEYNGIRVEVSVLQELSGELEQTLQNKRDRANELAGESFNPNSPKQLRRILFEKLELPVQGKTSTGKPSTDADTLEALQEHHPLPEVILEYRRYNKIESTYLAPLVEAINPDTGRVHTEFNQTIAATGRLSSSNPNLQNIPVRDEFGRRVREAFVPSEERYELIAADYSQVELRILAHMSRDEALIQAFGEGKDIHSLTAADLFERDLEEVDEDDRRVAKVVNYGITYGLSAYGLSTDLDIPQPEAEQYIERYFQRYPGVKAFIDRTVERARERGYVETLRGRRRYIPELASGDFYRQQFAERAAVTARSQGTAADIMKQAMIDLDPHLEDFDCRLLLQVHDELVLEADEAEVDAVTEIVREKMGEATSLEVPLTVSVKIGSNWGEVSK